MKRRLPEHWMGGRLGENRVCICVAEPLCCPSEHTTTLLISYPSTQSKKLLKRKPQEAPFPLLLCENTARRQLSVNQEVGCHQALNMLLL